MGYIIYRTIPNTYKYYTRPFRGYTAKLRTTHRDTPRAQNAQFVRNKSLKNQKIFVHTNFHKIIIFSKSSSPGNHLLEIIFIKDYNKDPEINDFMAKSMISQI